MSEAPPDLLDRGAPAGGASSGAEHAFVSILFPPGLEALAGAGTGPPDWLADLNLDQVFAAIVARRDEEVLLPLLHATIRNEQVIRYRQAVFADLDRPEIAAPLPGFTEAMRSVRAQLHQVEQITARSHRNAVFLRAVGRYVAAVTALADGLRAAGPCASALTLFLAHLDRTLAAEAFQHLRAEADELRATLAGLHYAMLFRGDTVTVRAYAGEPDQAEGVLERFARFRESEDTQTPVRKPDPGSSLNHVEEAILERVSRLFPGPFARLDGFVTRHRGFIDATIARFDREIGFYVAYLDFIAPLRARGLPFCRPEVSATSKEEAVADGFDLALAALLVREGRSVVRNGFHLTGAERMLVVTGPNQGGKTTFARMFGQLHHLAALGCPVPGNAARLFLPDRIFTHFEREEAITTLRGKLEDELLRMRATCALMTPDSLIVLNEVFNATSLGDQLFLSTKVLERILAVGAIGVCVTFLDPLASLGPGTVSMVSVVDPADPARRTFEVVRRPADGLAHALSLARKHGLTYEQLSGRMRR